MDALVALATENRQQSFPELALDALYSLGSISQQACQIDHADGHSRDRHGFQRMVYENRSKAGDRLMTITTQLQCVQSQKLPNILMEMSSLSGTGYWKFELEHSSATAERSYWHVAVVQGRIIYTGKRLWSSAALLRAFIRFDAHSRQKGTRAILQQLQEQAKTTFFTPEAIWQRLKQQLSLTEDRLETVLKHKIYNDLDAFLTSDIKRVEFIANEDLAQNCIIRGLDTQLLIDDMTRRQRLWAQIYQQIPSVHCLPILDQMQLERAPLSAAQRENIRTLIQPHKSLNQIATLFGKDVLEIATTFAKLANLGIVKFDTGDAALSECILVVDDSLLVLKQFEHWLKAQGHTVGTCQDANNALSAIAQYNPAVIFIDINMPGISGFDLVRLIRQQPEMSEIPIVILTGEQKLSNKYRAQWSGCEFLTKPLSAANIRQFQTQLQSLLATLLSEPQKVASA
jgi:CheY-like chemotaxis protein